MKNKKILTIVLCILFYRSILFTSEIAIDQINKAHEFFKQGTDEHEKGNYQEAIKNYTLAIKLNPKNAGFFYNRANVKCLLKKYQEAIQDYDEAIKANPQYPFPFEARGHANYRLKKFQEAITDYNEALKKDNMNPFLFCNLYRAKFMAFFKK